MNATFVTPYRRQEMLIASTIRLANSEGFQYRIEDLLAQYSICRRHHNLQSIPSTTSTALGPSADDSLQRGYSGSRQAMPLQLYQSVQALWGHVSRLGLTTIQEEVELLSS
jgi:hypothetical protein